MTDYTLHVGDCLEGLRELPDGTARTCVTSPPYFGLRSYFPDAVVLRNDLPEEEKLKVEAELARLGIHPTSDGL